jgi:hypothetical protein
VEPEGIKPVMFRAMVLYLTPLYFFKPTALFTSLSLAQNIVVNHVMSYLFHSPANVIIVFGNSVPIIDILQI